MLAEPGRPMVVRSVGDEAGDGERHRQPVVVEAVRRGAAEARVRRGSRGRRRRRRPGRRAPSRPAAMPAIRSDSLWRSSPAPRIVVVPARMRRREAQDRDLVDRRRDVGRRRGRSPRRSEERTTRSAIGSPSSAPLERGRRALVDVGAHRPQQVDDGAAGRVDPDVPERELGVGMDRGRDEPEGGGRDVGRHVLDRSPAPPSLLPPSGRHRSPSVAFADVDPARPQHPLRVVARRDPFPDGRSSLGPKPRQQDRRLDLRRRHRRRVVHALQRGVPDHGEGREGIAGADRGAPRPSDAAAR